MHMFPVFIRSTGILINTGPVDGGHGANYCRGGGGIVVVDTPARVDAHGLARVFKQWQMC